MTVGGGGGERDKRVATMLSKPYHRSEVHPSRETSRLTEAPAKRGYGESFEIATEAPGPHSSGARAQMPAILVAIYGRAVTTNVGKQTENNYS